MPETALNELLELLEQERSLLIKGEVDAVAALAEQKEELIEQLRTAGPLPAEGLSKLRERALRNKALLDASRTGLKAAATRLKEIRKAMLQLDTYNRDGNLTNLQTAQPKVEKRA